MKPDPDVELQPGDWDVLLAIFVGPDDGTPDAQVTDRAARVRLWQRGYVAWSAGVSRMTPAGTKALMDRKEGGR